MWTDRVIRTVLPNGLTVLIERYDAAPVFSVVMHVRAGYFDEPDEWVGISHVLEHLFFKRPDLSDAIQRLGGYLNAATIYDKTLYYAVLPSDTGALPAAVHLHADALTKLSVDADELARELEVIIQEANKKRDTPTAVVVERLFAKLYAQHRIRRWRIGTEDGLRRITQNDVTSFYDTRYTPDRTIVAMVGDLDPEEALHAARLEFEPWDRTPCDIPASPPEVDPPPPSFQILTGDVRQTLAVLGWRTRGGLHADVAALDVAAAVLGSGRGSWLGRTVRQRGLASSATASHYSVADVGVFSLFLEGNSAGLDEALERAMQLVAGMDQRVHADDLACAKTLIASRWSRRMETSEGRAMMYCEFESLGGFEQLDSWYDTVQSVTAAQVVNAVSSFLEPKCASGVMYAAADHRSRYASAAWPLAPVPLSADDAPIPAGFEGYRANRPTNGKGYQDGTVVVELPGADLLVRSKRGSGLAHVAMYADSLRAEETVDQAGISSLLLRASLRGANGRPAEDLARLAESLGGSVLPTILSGWCGWAITVEQPAVASAAKLLFEIGRSATLDPEMVETERALLASDAARALDDMSGYPIRRVIQDGLPGAWYGVPVLGEPSNVGRLEQHAVVQWAERLRQRRLTVVVVGDAATDDLIAQALVFDAWPAADRAKRSTTTFQWTASRGYEPREKAQTAMAMAFPASPYGSPDHLPATVAAAMLGGLAGRLFRELRDDRALAYSVSASPWFRSRAGALLTYVATSPEREDEAREQMLDTLRRFVEEGFVHDELERARNYVAGRLLLRHQSASAVAGELVSAWLHDDLHELAELPSRLRGVGAADVEEVMRRIFEVDARAEFVVRGSGAVSG